ncbi:MAG TPA: sigma-70 family RNA polymerase sigma factor [Pyrinomonadaceae bacterium]|nr:sigma-70 family RNA polymerase sigma factor [Pyrinomonadaceae bacterium]
MESLALVLEYPQTDLIDECRSGNREAMHSLFVEHQRRVYSIALNFFGNADKADDITQQVFLKLFTKMNFRGEAEFTTWLYRMTVNACIDETRRSRRLFGFADWFGTREPAAKISLDEKIHKREIAAEVQTVIGSLKPAFRLPLVLKYVEGLSYQEIADVLECSIGTVSSRINRGHKMLADKLRHLKGELR